MRPRQPAVPPPELAALLSAAVGKTPSAWFTPHTGLSRAQRFIVHFTDGSSLFLKAATDAATEGELRSEHEILTTVAGDFLPRTVAWITTAAHPVLVLEDLSAAHWPADHWPVEWRPGQFDLLFQALGRMARTSPPSSLPRAEAGFEPQWPIIAADPEPFLALGLCSETWFRRSIDTLVAAEAAVPLAGDALVHNDVRSDNLCFLGDRVVLVDWGSALRGNRELDLSTALTTLPLEGGPDPFTIMPGAGAWAAYHSGRSARRASRPATGPDGSGDPAWLRAVLQRITAINLAWAAQSLRLLPFDGKHWRDIA